MAKKIKVIVAQGVKHQGKYPAIGTQIELDESEAKRLLESGAVTLPTAVQVVDSPPPPPAGKTSGGKAADAPPAGKTKGGKAADTPSASEIDDTELLNRIAAAETTEELLAIIPQEKPSEAVIAAAEQRQAELLAAGK